MTDSTLTLALAPARTYARLRSAPASPVWRGLARRLVLIALVIGTSVTLAATASAGIALVAQATLWWSVAPLLQLLLATAVVLSAHDRPIPWARGVELMLAAHVPWSLWLLAMVPLVAAGLRGRVFLITMGLSLAGVVVWRAVLLYHFCRIALGRSRAGAIVRTLLHQATVIALLLMYAAWAIALPARLR
jgi:hypothetical protein